MKKKIVIFFILLFTISQAFGQDFKGEFGIIEDHEIAMNSYDKDPAADAMVLFDIGESEFIKDVYGGYDIRFTRTRRTKVFRKGGVNFAEVEIPFYVDDKGNGEKIVSLEAYTYNTDNGLINKKKVDQSVVFEEQINEHWKRKKFVFPDVKEGSIIEYKYVLESPFLFNLPDWYFQDNIPTAYSKYTVSMIPFYEYVFMAQQISSFDHHSSKTSKVERTFGSFSESYGQNLGDGVKFHDVIHTFILQDVPAFTDESYITSKNDYIKKIDFQLAKVTRLDGTTSEIISTWPKLIDELYDDERFGRYIKSSKSFANQILKEELSIQNAQNDREKVKMIVEYVRKSFSWNNKYSRYASKKPRELMKERTGNSADINLFLLAVFNAADISAKPVIISTRGHGKINMTYPFMHFFNDVVILSAVDGNYFLFDGTQELLEFNRIPPECMNEVGLVVEKKEENWVQLMNSILSIDNMTILLDIDPNTKSARTRVNMQTTEYMAYQFKSRYKNDTLRLKKYLLEDFKMESIDKIQTYNYDNSSKPYVMSFEGETEIEMLGDKLIVSPFLQYPMHENMLKQETRTYPVDLVFATREHYKADIKIPEGYQVIYIPENYKVDDNLMDISINFLSDKNVIVASAVYTFKKSVYPPSEYEQLKKHLDTVVKRFNEEIVLEKISN